MTANLLKDLIEISIIKKNNRNNSPDSFFSKNDAQLLSTPSKKMIKVTKNPNLKSKLRTTPLHKKIFSSKINFIPCKINLDRNSVGAKPKSSTDAIADNVIKELQGKYLTALSEIQNSFRIELDNLYKENFDKIEEVNKKYNYDLYKSNTSNNVKYNKLLNEKNTELNDIENEFIIKKNYALVTFNEKICKLKESIISEINKEGYKFKEEMMMKYQMQFSGINNKKKVPVSNNVLSARKEWKF